MLMVLMIADWLDYPGFEAWRFVNLFLFIAVCLLLHRRFGRPISEGLGRRRANIKLELDSARQRRDAAAAELVVVESRLAEVDKEVAKIRAEAEAEAEMERRRLKAGTEEEISKLKSQVERCRKRLSQLRVRTDHQFPGVKFVLNDLLLPTAT